MNLRALLLAAVSCFATIQAEVTWINHDQVQPFAQPEPATDSETAAVKFKPFLEVSYGCEPYPAVSANGSVSASLKWTGKNDGDCEGSALGSQVYSRSDWYKDKWAMMYAWYFPKGWQGRPQSATATCGCMPWSGSTTRRSITRRFSLSQRLVLSDTRNTLLQVKVRERVESETRR